MSWTQAVPQVSLDLIEALKLPKTAPIIDIGGGDSSLAGFLLERGYKDITVSDISETALERGRAKLGIRSGLVHWIACDITHFQPERLYHLWHDRATFHFLTESIPIESYRSIARAAVSGHMIIGTFAEDGHWNAADWKLNSTRKSNWRARSQMVFKKWAVPGTTILRPSIPSRSLFFAVSAGSSSCERITGCASRIPGRPSFVLNSIIHMQLVQNTSFLVHPVKTRLRPHNPKYGHFCKRVSSSSLISC